MTRGGQLAGTSGWKQKRFWESAVAVARGDQFAVELDGRRLKTPAGAELLLPTRAMADAVAGEWAAQDQVVDPLSMPFTRSANAAIDKVSHQHGEVADMLVEYGNCDLLCYRATGPEALIALQSEHWDPALDWAAKALDVRLKPCAGIIHQPQDTADIARLSARVHAMTPFQLAAFHDLVSLSGSLILGFGAALGWRDAQAIWRISRLDESWQEQQWGADPQAQALAQTRERAFAHAKQFFEWC